MADLALSWRDSPLAARTPHLLHVFPNFDVGGSQVRFASLVSRLGSHFDHTVIALNGSWDAKSLLPGDAAVALLSIPPGGSHLSSRLLRIHQTLRAIAPDALLTYNWGAIEWALANAGRLPHLHHEDGFGPEEIERQLPRRIWTRRLALRHSRLLVPSRVLADVAVKSWGICPDRVHHIPNGIAPRIAADTPLQNIVSDIAPHLCRIAWVGALRPEKNPLRLLRAFAPLAERAVLLIVGEGPERETLLREAFKLGVTPHLRLLGRRADARDIVIQSDILALSSDTEQMPFAVLEAMDAGLPVASVDVGDVREMVAAANREFIVPRDARALSGALAKLVKDRDLRHRVGEANRQRVRTVYQVSEMAMRYRVLFDAVLKRGADA